jgi:hypothetical protein
MFYMCMGSTIFIFGKLDNGIKFGFLFMAQLNA